MAPVPGLGRLARLAAALSLAGSAALAGGNVPAGKDTLPAFSLVLTSGETLHAPLVALSPDGSVQMAVDKLAAIKVSDWLTLRLSKTPLPPHPRGPQVVLTTGDRIPLADKSAIKIVDNQLHFQPHASLRAKRKGVLEVPLSRVVLVWLGGPDGVEEPAALLRQLLRGSRKKDLVLLRNGDKVDGNVVALDSASSCCVDVAKKQIDVPWANVGAVAFSTELLAGKPPAAVYYHLVLASGGRLSVQSPSLPKGAQALAATTLFGGEFEVPVDQIVGLHVYHGAAVYLSELKPRKFEHTPYVGTAWPLVVDGSVSGGELCLAGSTFDRGLGMHAESKVNYDLDGKYQWFEALVGLDPEHGKKGRVRIRIVVDGKPKDFGWNKELTASDGALPVRLDVRGGRELTLEVLFGGFGDVQAHVNWVDARLIKN
jgi:hypothetical protein